MNKSNNNVLIVGFSLGMGGTQRMMVNLLNELCLRDIKAYVYLYNSYNKTNLESELIYYKIEIAKCESTGKFKHFQRFYKLLKLIKAHNINRTICFSSQGAHYSILAKIFVKREMEIYYRMVSVKKSIKYSQNKIQETINTFLFNEIVMRFVDKIICQSTYMKKDLLENNPKLPSEKLIVLNNFFNTGYIENKADEILECKEEYILYVGRLSDEKNVFGIIDAFSLISDKVNVNLVLLGEGKLESELKLHVSKLGLSNRILFTGFQLNPYKYMKLS